MKKLLILLSGLLMLLAANICSAQVTLGVERLGEPAVQRLVAQKRIGLFTNQSGVDSKLTSSVELAKQHVNLQAIFVPEHGLFGAVAAGDEVQSHDYAGIPVISLYSGTHRPTQEMLEKIDAMLVDIQDVGIRHYTYFSSLAYIMEECAKHNKEVIILDRPNPLGGAMEGPVLKKEYATFVGLYPLPLRHGLTIGEFARFINETQKLNCRLEVVPMKGWKRSMLWQDTGLPWVMTSPQIPTAETALLYGVTGVIGDSTLSAGIGTTKPFAFVGAPFAESSQVKSALDALEISGAAFRAASFTPRYGEYAGELVQGVEVYVLDTRKVNLAELQYKIYLALQKLYPEKVQSQKREYADGYKMDIVLGESSLRECAGEKETFARWQQECADFAKEAQPYLLYK